MDVDEALREIDAAIEETFDRRRLEELRREPGSRREAYEKSLDAVDRHVGAAGVDALAEWLTDRIHEEERLPSSREVRKEGASISRDLGQEVSTGSWLGS